MRQRKVAALARRIGDDASSGLLAAPIDSTALARFTLSTLGSLARLARDGASRGELEAVSVVALAAWPPEIRESDLTRRNKG